MAPGKVPTYATPDGSCQLFVGDCLEVVPLLALDRSVDMIFADPPYFLSNGGITCQSGRMVSVDKGEWDASAGPEANHEFNLRWLRECARVLTDDGTLWVSGTSHVIHSVGYAMQQLGMKILNDITWEKPNPPPNLSCRYFTHATETLLWAARSQKSRHYFDYDAMKRLNGGKQMKSVWRLTAPGAAEKTCGRHPTQKPLALLERIVQASTPEGALVLDPFNGSGTTGVACLHLHRRYIGIERDATYIDLTRKRLESVLTQPGLF